MDCVWEQHVYPHSQPAGQSRLVRHGRASEQKKLLVQKQQPLTVGKQKPHCVPGQAGGTHQLHAADEPPMFCCVQAFEPASTVAARARSGRTRLLNIGTDQANAAPVPIPFSTLRRVTVSERAIALLSLSKRFSTRGSSFPSECLPCVSPVCLSGTTSPT